MEKAMDKILKMLEDVIDKIKTSNEDIPVILIGGGSVLIKNDVKLSGCSQIIRPENFGCANALGAANA